MFTTSSSIAPIILGNYITHDDTLPRHHDSVPRAGVPTLASSSVCICAWSRASTSMWDRYTKRKKYEGDFHRKYLAGYSSNSDKRPSLLMAIEPTTLTTPCNACCPLDHRGRFTRSSPIGLIVLSNFYHTLLHLVSSSLKPCSTQHNLPRKTRSPRIIDPTAGAFAKHEGPLATLRRGIRKYNQPRRHACHTHIARNDTAV